MSVLEQVNPNKKQLQTMDKKLTIKEVKDIKKAKAKKVKNNEVILKQ